MGTINDVWKRDEIDSPCQKLCVIHEGSGFCVGCLRTLAEITEWSNFSQQERDQIRIELPARKPLLRANRSKRASRRRPT